MRIYANLIIQTELIETSDLLCGIEATQKSTKITLPSKSYTAKYIYSWAD